MDINLTIIYIIEIGRKCHSDGNNIRVGDYTPGTSGRDFSVNGMTHWTGSRNARGSRDPGLPLDSRDPNKEFKAWRILWTE